MWTKGLIYHRLVIYKLQWRGWGKEREENRRESEGGRKGQREGGREEGGKEEEIEERGEMLEGSEKECQKANTDNS